MCDQAKRSRSKLAARLRGRSTTACARVTNAASADAAVTATPNTASVRRQYMVARLWLQRRVATGWGMAAKRPVAKETFMRTSRLALALCSLLAVPAAVLAKHNPPSPPTCSADVDATLAAACPCPGTMAPDGLVTPWRNHGQYVRCVVHARNALRKGGCVAKASLRSIARCAAHSTCGKAGAPVACCVPMPGNCSDLMPDGNAQGTCSNDPTRACDVAADCTEIQVQQVADGAACTMAGGTLGAGSTCNPCVVPLP